MVAVALGSGIKFTPVTLYKPLSNKYFDDKILKSRQRYGTQLRSMYNCSEIFKESKEKARAYIFATDQNPPKGTKTIWLNFLNQETSIFLGAEKYAKQYNLPVIFCKVRKVKRGFYEINLELLTENPNELADGEITKMHVKALENLIYENPQYWLWTHKRWKYKKEEVINNS